MNLIRGASKSYLFFILGKHVLSNNLYVENLVPLCIYSHDNFDI